MFKLTKKNILLSVAAAATLIMTNPTGDQADAAEIQRTTYYYNYSFSNYSQFQEQIDSILQNFYRNWGNYYSHKVYDRQNDSLSEGQQTPSSQEPKENVETKPETETTEKVEQPKEPSKTTDNTTEQVEQPKDTNTTADTKVEAPTSTPTQQTPETTTTTPSKETSAPSTLNEFEQQVVELTNQERAKYGLPALSIDVQLSKVARMKSEDMQQNNYFSHTSPTYGSPFDMMRKFGVTYKAAGENIAKGQRSPEEVVNAWMNSEGHRANILSSKFTHIGVGYVADGNIWTQQFIGK